MQFICQIALTADLFGDIEPRMAYLFLTDDEDATAETWDPDGGENAVILQPGGIWEGPSEPRREGPTLCQRTSSGGVDWVTSPVELAVDLQSGEDAEEGAWDDIDFEDQAAEDSYFEALFEDKVGGTPVPTVNTSPRDRFAVEEWRLLLQLNTKGEDPSDLFWVNFASDGTGYAFISQDGRRAKFIWSR